MEEFCERIYSKQITPITSQHGFLENEYEFVQNYVNDYEMLKFFEANFNIAILANHL